VVYGAAVLIFFFCLLSLALVSQQGLPFASRTTVKAEFNDVGSMRTGDDVRIANVRVGYVSDIVLVDNPDAQGGKGGQAKVALATLKLDNDRPVYKNAQTLAAQVASRSGLGQKFVDLNPGDPAAGLLPADYVIPPARTESAQELSDVLRVLDLPTRQAIGSVVRNIGGGLAGHGQDLHAAANAFPDVLPDLGNVSLALANNNGRDFASLLNSANELSVSFRGRQDQIGQLLGKLDKTFAGLNADNGKALAATLHTAPDSLRAARGALTSLDAPLMDTGAATKELRPGGQALGRSTPDVRGFLRESRTPLDKVPGVSDDGQPAFDHLGDAFDRTKPFSPMLVRAFGRGAPLAQRAAPYVPGALMFFTNAAGALQQGNDNYHWLNFHAVLDAGENLTDALGGVVKNPLQARDANPEPGQAPHQQRGLPIPSGDSLPLPMNGINKGTGK
jgi:phospholipid/cholesterol/gamma-HCH transport system substrate-binding protein